MTSVEIFDPETETWSEGPSLSNALCGAGQCSVVIFVLINCEKTMDGKCNIQGDCLKPERFCF